MPRACLAFFVFLPLAPYAGPDEGPAIPTLALGSAAPDFDLPGIDGRRHTLKDFATARLLVLVFTTNHCPTAQAYQARVAKLHDAYAGKGAAVVAGSPKD